ncbi:hypothetical protein [Dactylosporangium sp. CA-233914]|uniref:hypothetical protein n=1 Tax=Dactylosporangium sp. CA-233914 TaxID=3239934 RepID=UPI003D8C8326
MGVLRELVVIGLLCFVVAAAIRFARAGRIGDRLDPGRLLTTAVSAGVLGAVLVTLTAAVLLAMHRADERGGDAGELRGAVLLTVGCAVALPAATWLTLRLMGIRPAWFAALGAWSLLGLCSGVAQAYLPGGALQPAWFYGLLAVLPFATGALAADPALSHTRPPIHDDVTTPVR